MHLNEKKNELRDLIRSTADYLEIKDVYVEKDYWLVRLLKEIFKRDPDYVFKGGTSLSKCYHLIDRFSEDIDISYSVDYRDIDNEEKNKKFKNVVKAIKKCELTVRNPDNLRGDRYFNQFICPYPSVTGETNIGKQIIVELAAQTPSYPSNKRMIRTFISEYLESIGRMDLIELYGLEPFEITVQSLERTFVDKTFAICDYYLADTCKNHSRHIYDISKILPEIKLDDNLVKLYKEIGDRRRGMKVCYSSMEGVKLHIIVSRIIKEESYKNDYNKLTYGLLYEKYPYELCLDALIKVRAFLEKNDI